MEEVQIINDAIKTISQTGWKYIYTKYIPYIKRNLKLNYNKLLEDKAEDIAHDTILKLLSESQKSLKFEHISQVNSWMLLVAKNSAKDFFKSLNGQLDDITDNNYEDILEIEFNDDEKVLDPTIERVNNAIDQLIERDRIILRMKMNGTLSKEIAAAVNLNPNGIREYIKRAISKFKIIYIELYNTE